MFSSDKYVGTNISSPLFGWSWGNFGIKIFWQLHICWAPGKLAPYRRKEKSNKKQPISNMKILKVMLWMIMILLWNQFLSHKYPWPTTTPKSLWCPIFQVKWKIGEIAAAKNTNGVSQNTAGNLQTAERGVRVIYAYRDGFGGGYLHIIG